jgi:transcriptional regulator with XRE-family HTH domain
VERNSLRVLPSTLHIRRYSIQDAAVDLKALGQRVRLLRLRKNWQQQELARRAGVTTNTLRGLERGTLHTRWPKFEAIAKALGTTPDLLLRSEEPVADTSPLLRDLNEEDLRVAQAFHHSRTTHRMYVQRVLSGHIKSSSLELLDRIDRLTEDEREAVSAMVGIAEQRPEPSTPTKRKATKHNAG